MDLSSIKNFMPQHLMGTSLTDVFQDTKKSVRNFMDQHPVATGASIIGASLAVGVYPETMQSVAGAVFNATAKILWPNPTAVVGCTAGTYLALKGLSIFDDFEVQGFYKRITLSALTSLGMVYVAHRLFEDDVEPVAFGLVMAGLAGLPIAFDRLDERNKKFRKLEEAIYQAENNEKKIIALLKQDYQKLYRQFPNLKSRYDSQIKKLVKITAKENMAEALNILTHCFTYGVGFEKSTKLAEACIKKGAALNDIRALEKLVNLNKDIKINEATEKLLNQLLGISEASS